MHVSNESDLNKNDVRVSFVLVFILYTFSLCKLFS